MLAATLDFFLEDVFRLPMRKALDPNDPHDFQVICQQLAKATAGLAQPEEAKALKAALAALDVDWKSMKPDAKAKVVLAAKQAVNPVKSVLPKIEDHYEANALKLGQQVKGATKKTFGFEISPDLTAVQVKSLQAVAFSSANYVRDEYGKRSDVFSLKAKQIVVEELAKGTPNKEIVDRLRAELTTQQFNRSRSYWEVASMAFANRARTYVNLESYQESGIEEFIFDSVLDERTSHVCRFMHGRHFPVAKALGAYAASETGNVKIEQPWVQQTSNDKGQPVLYVKGANGEQMHVATVTSSAMGKVDERGKFSGKGDDDLASMGIMTPPLHGRCRSSIRPIEGSTTVSVPTQVQAPAPPAPLVLTPSEPEEPAAPPAAPAPAPPPVEQEGLKFPAGGISNQPAFLFPEQQGLAFGPGGIAMKPIELAPLDPVAPPVKAYIPLNDKKDDALKKLQQLKLEAAEEFLVPNPVPYGNPKDGKGAVFFGYGGSKLDALEAAEAAGLAKKGNKLISSMKSIAGEVDSDKVEKYLKNPKLLQKVQVKVVKVGGTSYVVEGHEAVAAAHLLEKWKLPVSEINLKQAEAALKEQAKAAALKPKAPPIPPAPTPAPVPSPPPPPAPLKGPVDPASILAKKYGDAKGSNEGGFYEGADGVKRYVKFYSDPAQAHGEVLANALYKALGFESPEAVTFEHNGKHVYAVKLLEGQTLGSAGPTAAHAKEFFKGFAADILSANWDAAGQSVDNAFLLKNGKIARIDNGGCFLMRAKAGRKSPGVLNSITELEGFFPGNSVYNPGYHKLASLAGYSSVEDFKDDFKKQVAAIDKVKSQFGTWSNFVSQYAPGLTGKDREAIVTMLDKRHELLQKQAVALFAPPPPKPPPGVKPSSGFRYPSIKGVAPSPKLTIKGLPEASFNPDDFNVTPISGAVWQPKNPKNPLPWGESHADYKARTKKELVTHISEDARRGVSAFTGSSYGAIRRSEISGSLDTNAKRIVQAFKQGVPEPCSVIRAITVPKDVAEQMIRRDGVFRLGENNTGATSSTTWDAAVGLNWSGGTGDPGPSSVKVKFLIHQKTGLPVETISQNEHENEILLSKDAQFKVVGSGRFPGKQNVILIELEEI